MFRKALISLFYILIISSVFADSLEVGSILFNEASALYQEGNFAHAYKLLSQSILIFEQQGKEGEELLMNAHLWAGASSYHLGEYEKTERHYLLSLDLAEKLNSIPYQSNIITAMANLKFGIAEYSEAGDWYLRSADIHRKTGSIAEANSSFEYGGYAKVMGGHYPEALQIFEEAIVYSSSDRAASEKAWLHAMRGNCRYYIQDLSEALEDYLLAVSLLEPYGSTTELTQYYGWVGKIFFDKNENERALEYFQKSLVMANDLNNHEDRSRVLAYFGFLYFSSGEYDLAARYYEDSLKAARTLGRMDMIVAAYESLVWIYKESGKDHLWKKNNEKLIDLYKRTNSVEKLATLLNEHGLWFFDNKLFEKAIPLFLESSELYRKAGHYKNLSVLLLNLGMSYENIGDMDKAGEVFRESLALSIESGSFEDVEDLAGHLTYLYSENFDYISLIQSLESLIPLYEREGRLTELMHLNNNIGTYYYALTEYDKAIEYYSSAGELARQTGQPGERAVHLHNIAQSRAFLSQFDQAFDIYNEALKLAEEWSESDVQGSIWNNMGELYRAWGWYEKSLSCYSQAEVLFEEAGDLGGLASVYNNMGQALRLGGQPKEAISLYEKALLINREAEDEESEAINLSNLGESYREMGQNDEAMDYYSMALQIDNRIQNLRGIHIRKNNMALLLLEEEESERAREIFSEGLKYWRSRGNKREEATALKNIWATYFFEDDYKNAVIPLEKAVAIIEELRLTAQGEVRREYLDSQVYAYRELAITYYFLEDPIRSLYYLELSRGKYLLEQLDILNENVSFNQEVLKDFLRSLDKKSALLSISITDENVIQAISVEGDSITTTIITIEEEFLENISSQYGNLMKRYVDEPGADLFENILKFYRILLTRPVQSRSTESARKEIGTYLYSRLIETFDEELSEIDHLLIIPDGLMATIPFGALQDEEGTYLIEDFDISYAQSLTVAQMINDRVYSNERKPLLAMGGAVYEESSWVDSEDQQDIAGIRQNVSQMIRNGEKTRGVYNSMGYHNWTNLPGTLQEVNLLSDIVAQSEVMTGSDVTEEKIKSLSASGELASYEVLHLATHGIVIPEVPELSAVVLSQFEEEGRAEDGYLTMSEISRLNVEADFVNLSACETGLGKIYQGEGIVGLTQAFLVAGANSLSVSLWQVADESTMKFMTGVYTLVEEQGMSYAQAISEMKRVFLRNEQYGAPFYWAPFVFYGNYEAGL